MLMVFMWWWYKSRHSEVMKDDEPLKMNPPRVRVTSRKWSRMRRRVRTRVRNVFAEKSHRGIAVAVFHKGEHVLSAVAGIGHFGGVVRSIEEDTLFMPFSVTKGMCAAAIATLVDSGDISYDDKISSRWPEFATSSSKKDVTIATAISHRAGLQHTSLTFVIESIYGYFRNGKLFCSLSSLQCTHHTSTHKTRLEKSMGPWNQIH